MSRRVDMTPAAIEARLQMTAALSPLGLAPLQRVNMSPVAVELRLETCAELSAFCMELAQLRRSIR